MKKTLTVNLNNIVFHIDDDAYDALQNYLNEIEKYLSEDEKKEVMSDVESRIAELFNERLQKNKNVISVEDVQEIIEILGKPSQFSSEDDESEEQQEGKKAKSETRYSGRRRYYRDPENAILGGVAGGIAAYLGWDVTLIRIALVALVFFGAGTIVPIYIIVWIVAPAALTAPQRLEMQGENVTVDSIKSEINKGVNNVKSYVESDKFKTASKTFGERLVDFLKVILKIFTGLIVGVFATVGIIILVALLFGFFGLLFNHEFVFGIPTHEIMNGFNISADKLSVLIISLILVVGCPIFMLIYWLVRMFTHRTDHPNRSTSLPWVILILWVAGLFMLFGSGTNTIIKDVLRNRNGMAWVDDNSPFKQEWRNADNFHKIDASGNIELILKQDSTQKILVEAPEGFLPRVKTEFSDGELKIYTDKTFFNRQVRVTVYSKSLTELIVSGASKVYAADSTFRFNDLKLELHGASEAHMKVFVAGLFDVNVSGASDADFSGTTGKLYLESSGASGVDANQLIARTGDIHVSGASHADVNVSDTLDAEASGASHIGFSGSPKSINKSSSGASEIEHN